MGAFHEGHLELMRRAKDECGAVSVSLFVNPTQFGPHEDFAAYPRGEEQDFALARSVGVDLMFAPAVEEMYRSRRATVHVSGVTEGLEGSARPTHFDGVATVVLKLFHLVRPDVAYFGLKDLQQCAVVRAMVEDLDVPVELRLLETVRESDGLAMSSRNRRLSPSERELAPELNRSMRLAAQRIREGHAVVRVLADASAALNAKGFAVDYLQLVEPESMKPLEGFRPGSRLVAAAKLGSVRLLDNIPADSDADEG